MSDERRKVLTNTERWILLSEQDVSDKNYYTGVSRVRKKIDRCTHDLKALEERGALTDELWNIVCHDAE